MDDDVRLVNLAQIEKHAREDDELSPFVNIIMRRAHKYTNQGGQVRVELLPEIYGAKSEAAIAHLLSNVVNDPDYRALDGEMNFSDVTDDAPSGLPVPPKQAPRRRQRPPRKTKPHG